VPRLASMLVITLQAGRDRTRMSVNVGINCFETTWYTS
jgi:hypothetical protein